MSKLDPLFKRIREHEMKRTALTIEAHGRKITVEFDHEDTTAYEWMDALETLMIGIGFYPETVKEAFKDKDLNQ